MLSLNSDRQSKYLSDMDSARSGLLHIPKTPLTGCSLSVDTGFSLFVKVKKDFRQKNTLFFENYNLKSLNMYNRLS